MASGGSNSGDFKIEFEDETVVYSKEDDPEPDLTPSESSNDSQDSAIQMDRDQLDVEPHIERLLGHQGKFFRFAAPMPRTAVRARLPFVFSNLKRNFFHSHCRTKIKDQSSRITKTTRWTAIIIGWRMWTTTIWQVSRIKIIRWVNRRQRRMTSICSKATSRAKRQVGSVSDVWSG